MATDRDLLVKALQGTLNSTTAANVAGELPKMLKVGKARTMLVATLNTAVANTVDWIIDTVPLAQFSNGYKVTDFRVIPFINLTADNTLNVILTLTKYNGGGGTGTTVATSNTAAVAGGGLGDLTKRIPYSCTITQTAAECAAGSVLTLSVLNAGASAAAQNMAGAVFEVLYEAL